MPRPLTSGVPCVPPSGWDGHACPSARANSHVLAELPPGFFPGVDVADIYTFP
ncbi:hypothetical protein ACIBO2_02365 [Nonomuraea sp. NPDC050022]|uniref:hypothetical protein n=1 Tax=Nonomuraea sp. NPDC050022 TaxID=3364358 RepID=UPI003792D4B8